MKYISETPILRSIHISGRMNQHVNVQLCETQIESYEDMMTLTCCQDHILTENIWFVWSKTSDSGDKWRCHRCGTTEQRQTVKIELLSQWMIEAEFRNIWMSLWQAILYLNRKFGSIFGRETFPFQASAPCPCSWFRLDDRRPWWEPSFSLCKLNHFDNMRTDL